MENKLRGNSKFSLLGPNESSHVHILYYAAAQHCMIHFQSLFLHLLMFSDSIFLLGVYDDDDDDVVVDVGISLCSFLVFGSLELCWLSYPITHLTFPFCLNRSASDSTMKTNTSYSFDILFYFFRWVLLLLLLNVLVDLIFSEYCTLHTSFFFLIKYL